MQQLIVSPPEEDSYWQHIFSTALSSASSWVDSARALRLSADVISGPLEIAWQCLPQCQDMLPVLMKHHPVFLMLCSYAAENYLKARIVEVRKWDYNTVGQNLPKELKSHDVAELSKSAGVLLNEEESDLAVRLSVYGVWAGRYPAPIHRKELRPRLVGAQKNLATFFRGSDVAVAQYLLERLDIIALSGMPPTIERRRSKNDGLVIQERVTPW